jgi:hypothetical protein
MFMNLVIVIYVDYSTTPIIILAEGYYPQPITVVSDPKK